MCHYAVAQDFVLPKPRRQQGDLPRLPARLDKQAGKAVGEVPVTTNLIGPPGWSCDISMREATAKGRVNLCSNMKISIFQKATKNPSVTFLFEHHQADLPHTEYL